MTYRDINLKLGITSITIQQEFKKTHGGKVPWQNLLKNRDLKQQIKNNDLNQTNPTHIKAFKKAFIKDIITNPKYEYDQKSDIFSRKNLYPQILNQKTLLAYIQKDSGGLLISDEILDFTYPQVGRDLDKLLSQGRLKKIQSSNKNKKDYYVFPVITEQYYSLKQDKQKYFGQEYFLKLCKDNYKNFSLLKEDESITQGGIGITTSHQRFNQWVTGYTDLKELWRKKNQQKLKQKA